MLFQLLHRPPDYDYLGLTMSVESLPESLAIKLSERLNEARKRTADGYKKSGRRGQ